MHCTRRLLERYGFVLVAFGACASTMAAAASCSSDGETSDPASIDVADGNPIDDTIDSATADAPTSPDATPFAGKPIPVVCGAAPCATALVTTLAPPGPGSDHYPEGFCALLSDGTVACWGANGGGQLGRGDDGGTADSATPARVLDLSDIVGLDHTCALDKHGAVRCWGTVPFPRGDSGVVATELTPVLLPLPPAKSVGVGSSVACAAVDIGVLCWGMNTFRQIASFESDPSMGELPPRAITFRPGPPVQKVVVGNASFALREDGSVVSWGNTLPLGRVSSLDPDPYPMPIAIGGVSSIDVMVDCACAVSGGVGYCWGATLDQASDPFNAGRLVHALPEPVVTPEPIVQIATTRNSGRNTSPDAQTQRWCAVGASGALYCWGDNRNGQVGDGTTNHAYVAVRVEGLPARVSEVRTTTNATCALLENGTIHCWGANGSGQLGNGRMKVPSRLPREVVLP